MYWTLFRCFIAMTCAICAAQVAAHEFWIDAESQIEPGDEIVADLKVGQMLVGEPYPFLSNRFTRFSIISAGSSDAIPGFDGDLPAVSGISAAPGLQIIAHQTVPFLATYNEWAVFQRYLTDEGLESFATVHKARGLPETGFIERYTRYAKALIQAGPVRKGDSDEYSGMKFELVAESNPFTPGQTSLPVRLYWQGEPLPDWQINVFNRNAQTQRIVIHTDATGRATLGLSRGEFLLNSVMLVPVDDAPVVWQSHWASLSFNFWGDTPRANVSE